MSPPIRAKHHQLPLQNALANGVLSLIGTGARTCTQLDCWTALLMKIGAAEEPNMQHSRSHTPPEASG
jgi:hypothetical protein